MVELICDGVYVHPATVRTTFKMFGDDRVILISDSMMACGLEDGQYSLGGQEVTVKEIHIPLESVVKCATANPVKAIGIYGQYGSLTPGKYAVVFVQYPHIIYKDD